MYNTADAAAPGAGRKGVMPPLYSDPTTTLFAKYFGGGPRDPLFHRSAIQECLYNENTGMLTVYQWLYWSAAAVLNPGQWGPDTTTTCYTALMWNCRLIFTLYDTYSGPKSPCQGIFEEDTSTRIESGRLLSVGLPPPQGCIRREGTSEVVPEAVRQAVGGGCQIGWGRLLSVTNVVEAGACRQGDSGWASAGRPGGGGGGTPPPSNASLPLPPTRTSEVELSKSGMRSGSRRLFQNRTSCPPHASRAFAV